MMMTLGRLNLESALMVHSSAESTLSSLKYDMHSIVNEISFYAPSKELFMSSQDPYQAWPGMSTFSSFYFFFPFNDNLILSGSLDFTSLFLSIRRLNSALSTSASFVIHVPSPL